MNVAEVLTKERIELNVKINLVDENHLEFYGDMLLTRKEEKQLELV